MKRVILCISIFLVFVTGFFFFLIYKDYKYSKNDYSSFQKQIKELDSKISKKQDEKKEIIENNPRKEELELWQSQVEKAKNY